MTELTVLYDADCGLCSHVARALTRADSRGQLRLIGIQSADLPDMPTREQVMESLHVRNAAGRWFSGAAAGVEIARRVPMLWPLSVYARLPLAMPMLDLMYRAVAGNRHTISELLGLKVCRVPARSSIACE